MEETRSRVLNKGMNLLATCMKPTTLALFALISAPVICHGQNLVESRDQATGWYVPVNIKVTAEGAKTTDMNVTVYKDNELLQEIHSTKSKVTLNLDLDNTYTFILQQEGYRPKSVYMDTHVPDQLVQYAAYDCSMNLEAADKFTHADPFYLDFPAAIVRWDNEAEGFLPDPGYLTDIQSRIGMLQAQMLPN